jgi:hypothetical protein
MPGSTKSFEDSHRIYDMLTPEGQKNEPIDQLFVKYFETTMLYAPAKIE